MPYFPQSQTKKRSPRVRVPNEETIRFNMEGHLIPAVLRKLSMTGGLADFPSALGEVTIAEAHFSTACGPVCGLVEILRGQSKNTHTYPFRFIALGDEDFKRLNTTLLLMQKRGLADA
ncbi:MAG TPA: hypothetical protein VKL40_01855 [Candidatus Angelobacter sp.]|nr:hypothetical protein [Candidatus Angelobacter sp.]